MASRVDFYTEDYDKLVQQKGMKCEWEQAIVCQCISEDSSQPDFSCPICHGSGFRYLPPLDVRVVATSFSSSVKLESLGIREPGTAYVTPPSDVIMGYRDRLRFVDFQCKFSEVIRFNMTEDGCFSQKTYRNIKSIQCLLKDGMVYQEGEDFAITPDRHHLCWTNRLNRPEPGDAFSILYMTTPAYLVTDLLHELRATYVERKVPEETFKEFPKQYQVRREDFVYGVNEPTPPPAKDEHGNVIPTLEEKAGGVPSYEPPEPEGDMWS